MSYFWVSASRVTSVRALDLGLGYQHAVERVAMVDGQLARHDRMRVSDRPLTETHIPYTFGKVGRSAELAGDLLDRDLPERDRAEEDIRVVAKAIEHLITQRLVRRETPQRHVGVQQQAHDEMPKSAEISALVCGESHRPTDRPARRASPRQCGSPAVPVE